MKRPNFIEVEGHSLKISNIVRISEELDIFKKRVLGNEPLPFKENDGSVIDTVLSTEISPPGLLIGAGELVNLLLDKMIDSPTQQEFQEEQINLKNLAFQNKCGSWLEIVDLPVTSKRKFGLMNCTLITKYVVIMRGSRPVHLYDLESYKKLKKVL